SLANREGRGDERRRDQRDRGDVVEPLIEVAHDEQAQRTEQDDQRGGPEQYPDHEVADHNQRSKACTNTSELERRSTATRTGNSNSAGRPKPSGRSSSSMTAIELAAS